MEENITLTKDQSEELIEEVVGQYDDKIPPLQFYTENLIDVQFDEKAFQDGMNEISKSCGMISGLFNVGCSEAFILDYLLNQQTIAYNLEAAKINSATNIEIAKHQKVIMDKQEL